MKSKKILLGLSTLACLAALTACDGAEVGTSSSSSSSVISSSSTTDVSSSSSTTTEASTTLAPTTSSTTTASTSTSTYKYSGAEHTADALITPSYELSGVTEDTYSEVLNDKGYAGLNDRLPDFSAYENTSAYRRVSTFEQLLDAIADAKCHYTSTITNVYGDAYIVRNNCEKSETNWNNALAGGLYDKVGDEYIQIPVGTAYPGNAYYSANNKDSKSYYEKSSLLKADYVQAPASGYTEENMMGTVRVIEITEDIDLGWKHIPAKYASQKTYAQSWENSKSDSNYTKSSMYKEHGITNVKIENTSNLMIYSKNGAKLTHGGFSFTSCDNIVVRNLDMDEMWQWEDSASKSVAKVGDYDAYGWAYFKISHCGNVWIDHCSFGKSFDGQIDVSNPVYDTKGTVFRAPYGADKTSAVHISWCKFNGGSDDPNGYLYKMMREIEEDYQNDGGHYLYYKALRDGGITFDEILYGVAIPQKKAFLDGDSANEYNQNTNLRVSIGNCYFRNVEDRIPKVRSGVAYMYNSVVDNFDYYSYRTTLQSKHAAVLVSKIKSDWKCALVSQCIVCGNGGSVAAKNCVYKGIEYLLKNNDSTLTNQANDPEATKDGGYLIENCSYQKTVDSAILNDNFPNSSASTLTESNFKWRTADGSAPFNVNTIDISKLSERLLNTSYGAGVTTNDSLTSKFTKTK